MEKWKRVIENIRRLLTEYITKNGIRSLVIGISGGIDSALCVALAAPVCEKMGIPLIGRSLPIESNAPEECKRAIAMGNAFKVNFREIDLTPLYYTILGIMTEEDAFLHGDAAKMATKIRNGNIKARIRMIKLYHLAALTHGLVLSTDNYTELMEGFFTLHGDVGDFGMIQNLWKTEVYEVAQYIVSECQLKGEKAKAEALDACIKATVTDGLGVSSSSLEQLGAKNYAEVDGILQAYCQGDRTQYEHPVIQRHHRTFFKRQNPYNLPRSVIFGNTDTNGEWYQPDPQ